MPKTIVVPQKEIEAAMPQWVKNAPVSVRELYLCSLPHRCEMHDAVGNLEAQDRIQVVAREWDIAKHTITLAEAERRWGKSNLRQNSLYHPFRWQAEDDRGTWLTTTYAMEKSFGAEPEQDRKLMMETGYTVYEKKFKTGLGNGAESLVVRNGVILAHTRGWDDPSVVDDNWDAPLLGQPVGKRGKGWRKLRGQWLEDAQAWADDVVERQQESLPVKER